MYQTLLHLSIKHCSSFYFKYRSYFSDLCLLGCDICRKSFQDFFIECNSSRMVSNQFPSKKWTDDFFALGEKMAYRAFQMEFFCYMDLSTIHTFHIKNAVQENINKDVKCSDILLEPLCINTSSYQLCACALFISLLYLQEKELVGKRKEYYHNKINYRFMGHLKCHFNSLSGYFIHCLKEYFLFDLRETQI